MSVRGDHDRRHSSDGPARDLGEHLHRSARHRSAMTGDHPPRWVAICGWLAIVAALPTVAWRAIVGLGVPLGTPLAWRRAEEIPGPGSWYVLGLSAGELLAASLTLVLLPPWADRLLCLRPVRAWRRAASQMIGVSALTGAAALIIFCTLSAIFWHYVDPFAGAQVNGWTWMCWASYLVAPIWPLALIATAIGYLRHRLSCPAGVNAVR